MKRLRGGKRGDRRGEGESPLQIIPGDESRSALDPRLGILSIEYIRVIAALRTLLLLEADSGKQAEIIGNNTKNYWK